MTLKMRIPQNKTNNKQERRTLENMNSARSRGGLWENQNENPQEVREVAAFSETRSWGYKKMIKKEEQN